MSSICIALSIFIASSTALLGISTAQAAQMDSDMNEDNSIGIVIEESSDALDSSKTSAAPDLGDDQAFPFIPGFGKNSGKDWSSFCLKEIIDNKLLIFSKGRKIHRYKWSLAKQFSWKNGNQK